MSFRKHLVITLALAGAVVWMVRTTRATNAAGFFTPRCLGVGGGNKSEIRRRRHPGVRHRPRPHVRPAHSPARRTAARKGGAEPQRAWRRRAGDHRGHRGSRPNGTAVCRLSRYAPPRRSADQQAGLGTDMGEEEGHRPHRPLAGRQDALCAGTRRTEVGGGGCDDRRAAYDHRQAEQIRTTRNSPTTGRGLISRRRVTPGRCQWSTQRPAPSSRSSIRSATWCVPSLSAWPPDLLFANINDFLGFEIASDLASQPRSSSTSPCRAWRLPGDRRRMVSRATASR